MNSPSSSAAPTWRTGRKSCRNRFRSRSAKSRFAIGERQLRVNASIGVAVYPEHCATADELFGNADLALYRAKAAGRGRYVLFERGIRDEIEARLLLEAELRRAVERKRIGAVLSAAGQSRRRPS